MMHINKLIDYIKELFEENKLFFDSNDTFEITDEYLNEFYNVIFVRKTDKKRNSLYCLEIIEKGSGKQTKLYIGPSVILFGKQFVSFRKELVNKKLVKGIITLKSKFFRNTAIPLSIIVLGNEEKETWFTTAASSDDLANIYLNLSNYHKRIFYTKNLSFEDFSPEFYNTETKKVIEDLKKYETRKLVEIAEVKNGAPIKRDEYTDVGIPILRSRDIVNGKIIHKNDFISFDSVDKYSKWLLQEGDILLTKYFGQNKIVRVELDDLPAIASNQMFIIRPYGIEEEYLYSYLTSDTSKESLVFQLNSMQRGVTIPSINLSSLKELVIPIYDNDTTSLIIDSNNKSDELKETAKELYEKIYINEKDLEKNVYDKLLNCGWKKEELVVEYKGLYNNDSTEFRWIPDIALFNSKEILAFMEVKGDLQYYNKFWKEKVEKIKSLNIVRFFIITTGFYFEIHDFKTGKIYKSSSAPSKDVLLDLSKGGE